MAFHFQRIAGLKKYFRRNISYHNIRTLLSCIVIQYVAILANHEVLRKILVSLRAQIADATGAPAGGERARQREVNVLFRVSADTERPCCALRCLREESTRREMLHVDI